LPSPAWGGRLGVKVTGSRRRVSFWENSLRWGASGGAWIHRLRWAHLVPEALAFSLLYRLGRGNRPLVRATVKSGRRPPGRYGRPLPPTAVAAVRLATSIWPFRTTCLVRSMVLARMLRRRGYSAHVVIGLPKEGLGRNPRFAHAWVEVEEVAGPPGFSKLVRLVP
jgi:hypothetical protein